MKEKELHIIVLCGVSVGLLTNNKKSANNTCKRTANNIRNSSLVTQSVLIFINLRTTYVALPLFIICIEFLQNKKREGTLSVFFFYWQSLKKNQIKCAGFWHHLRTRAGLSFFSRLWWNNWCMQSKSSNVIVGQEAQVIIFKSGRGLMLVCLKWLTACLVLFSVLWSRVCPVRYELECPRFVMYSWVIVRLSAILEQVQWLFPSVTGTADFCVCVYVWRHREGLDAIIHTECDM